MGSNYFSDEEVFEMLGGLQKRLFLGKKKLYRLNNGEIIVIRNSKLTSGYYWYTLQRDILNAGIDNIVFVAGFDAVFSIPTAIISELARDGHIILVQGRDYKPIIKQVSGKMCLRIKEPEAPIDIERYRVSSQFYEKTNEIGPEQASLLREGAKKTVIVNAYERNIAARRKCIEHYDSKCQICGFDFAQTYGSDFEGLIEVHHIIPISSIQSEYIVDPINDLIPLCSNCHTAIHKTIDNRMLTVEELRQRILSHEGKEDGVI